MLFRDMDTPNRTEGGYGGNPDFPQDDFNFNNPFEYGKGPDNDDFFRKLIRLIFGLIKLGLGITLLIVVFSILPGVGMFFIMLGKAFFAWVSGIFGGG